MRSIFVVDVMGGLGDLVLALPMVHALALSHPEASVHVATLAPWHELLENDPLVTEVIPLENREEDTVRQRVTATLHRLRPELGVTTNRWFGLPALLERLCDVAVTDLWRSPPPDELVDARYVRLLADDGLVSPEHTGTLPRIALTDAERDDGCRLLAGLVPHSRPLVLFPGAGMAVKRWPVQHWIELVRLAAAQGYRPLVVSQSAELTREIAAGAVPAPALSLRRLAAVCAAAGEREGAAVGGDTGPVRLAAAAGLPAVALHGPTLGVRYGLRPGQGMNLQGLPGCGIRRPTAITEQACWWHADCPLAPHAGPACMQAIRPDAVAAALAELPAAGAPSA